MEVMEDREVWRLNLELLPPQPSRKSGQWRKKKKKKALLQPGKQQYFPVYVCLFEFDMLSRTVQLKLEWLTQLFNLKTTQKARQLLRIGL